MTYCSTIYSSMMWPLFGDGAKKVFNCWNTCVKLAWCVDRATHTYFVDNFLASGFPSLKMSTVSNFLKFFLNAKKSPSLEVRVIAELAASDASSVTGSNILNLKKLFPNILHMPYTEARLAMLSKRAEIPVQDQWRIGCLRVFLERRQQLEYRLEDTKELDMILKSLCIT